MAQTLMSSLEPLVSRLAPKIDAALREYSCLPAGCPAPLGEAMRYSLLAPGKRMRPMLALLAAEACGGTSRPPCRPPARRKWYMPTRSFMTTFRPWTTTTFAGGGPTCHKVYGEAMAILAGDALLSLAFQVLAEHVRPAGTAGACCAALAEAAGPCQLVGGQADDILADEGALGVPA